MIRFQDFAPKVEQSGLFRRDVATFSEAVAEANAWIAAEKVEVLNFETVVLPEMWSEDGTTDGELTTSSEMMNSWNQFVRVWYREK